MADIRLGMTQELIFDLVMDGPDLATDDGLETAAVVSLFTDARADPEELPEGHDDRRGFWGSDVGSKLWTLSREKTLNDVVVRAEEYTREALQWMQDDGVVSSIEVAANLESREKLGINVYIRRVEGGDVSLRYAYNWKEQIAQAA